ncbi:hypothetical protein H0X90_34600 [Burkholderia sp. 9775_39]|uniref:hypothetical protein n=1 Tax=unclassified Burkholderia TaxID=2613784 RepID=UPI0018C35559|nr:MULTISPECIES: hypothetical protein [unclassified Burkholderia]MBG0881933.1 hypothetical protein [Burkholderia sp. 9775_39]MBG0888860.1 hypothetical protein [Burkholderia sp. 9773_38]
MTILNFGPVDVGPHLSSFTLPVPGTNGALTLRHADPKAAAPHPALGPVLRPGETVSVFELLLLLPALADAQWKPVNAGLGPVRREWTAVLDDVRANLIVAETASQDAANQALQQLADTVQNALRLARDVMTGYWCLKAGPNEFTAFVRADNFWWVSAKLPPGQAHRVSRIEGHGIDADPVAAINRWAVNKFGTDVTISLERR